MASFTEVSEETISAAFAEPDSLSEEDPAHLKSHTGVSTESISATPTEPESNSDEAVFTLFPNVSVILV
jgi:hypothetical protein